MPNPNEQPIGGWPTEPADEGMASPEKRDQTPPPPPPTSGESEGSKEASKDAQQKLTQERDEYKDKWARALADLDNYRRRVQKEMEEDRKYSAIPLIRAVLPGMDNLDRAVQAAGPNAKVEDLVQGVKMVYKQFEKALSDLGAVPITAVGEPFDPNRHEAVQQIPSDKYPAMTVVQDVERGYTLQDRVIRPTKVIVSSGPSA